MKDAILYGNGFNLVADNKYSWNDLLKELGSDSEVLNSLPPTMQYEHIFLNSKREYKEDAKKSSEYRFKEAIVRRLETFKHNRFYDRILNLPIEDYLTTNYDDACWKGISDEVKHNGNETTYSILRNIDVEYDGKSKCFYPVHGNMRHIRSMMLGLDQYIGSIRRIEQWVKGEYVFEKGKISFQKVPSIARRMQGVEIEKAHGVTPTKSGLYSWVDAFFFRNLHIIGFGLDFSETDIWWLLVKRARYFKSEFEGMTNKIYYYPTDPIPSMDINKLNYLRSLNVDVVLHSNMSGLDGTKADYAAIFGEQLSNLKKNLLSWDAERK